MKRILLLLVSVLLLSGSVMAQVEKSRTWLGSYIQKFQAQIPSDIGQGIQWTGVSLDDSILTFTYKVLDKSVAERISSDGINIPQRSAMVNALTSDDDLWNLICNGEVSFRVVYQNRRGKPLATLFLPYSELMMLTSGYSPDGIPSVNIHEELRREAAQTSHQLPWDVDNTLTLVRNQLVDDTMITAGILHVNLSPDDYTDDVIASTRQGLFQNLLSSYGPYSGNIVREHIHFRFTYLNDRGETLINILIEPSEWESAYDLSDSVWMDTSDVNTFPPVTVLGVYNMLLRDLGDDSIAADQNTSLIRQAISYYVDTIFRPTLAEDPASLGRISQDGLADIYVRDTIICLVSVLSNKLSAEMSALDSNYTIVLNQLLLRKLFQYSDLLEAAVTGRCSMEITLVDANGAPLSHRFFPTQELNLQLESLSAEQDSTPFLTSFRVELDGMRSNLPFSLAPGLDLVECYVSDTNAVYHISCSGDALKELSSLNPSDREFLRFRQIQQLKTLLEAEIEQAVSEHVSFLYIYLNPKNKELFRILISAEDLLN